MLLWQCYLLYNICFVNRLNIPNTFCEDLFFNYVDSVLSACNTADSCSWEEGTQTYYRWLWAAYHAVAGTQDLWRTVSALSLSSAIFFNKWSHLDNLEKSHVFFLSLIDPSIFSVEINVISHLSLNSGADLTNIPP